MRNMILYTVLESGIPSKLLMNSYQVNTEKGNLQNGSKSLATNGSETANNMSFDTKYTNLTSEGDVRCLTPEGPNGLKVLNTSHPLKMLNCIFLSKNSCY